MFYGVRTVNQSSRAVIWHDCWRPWNQQFLCKISNEQSSKLDFFFFLLHAIGHRQQIQEIFEMVTWHEQSSCDVTEQIGWPTVPLPWWNYVEPAASLSCWISVAFLLSGCNVHTGPVLPLLGKGFETAAHRWDTKTLSLPPNFLRF